MRSFVLTVLGGLVVAGLAIWDAAAGNPGAPVWTLPALGLIGCIVMVVTW